MKPQWQKVASLALENAHSSFSSLVQSFLPKDTPLRTYLMEKRKLVVLLLLSSWCLVTVYCGSSS